MMRRWLRILGLGLGTPLLVLAAPIPALADAATPTNYRSEVTGVEAAGVAHVVIVGGDAFVSLESKHGSTVEILGYEGEPYIRFGADGSVEINRRSPATYLNDDRYANVTLPAEADAAAPPRWDRIANGGRYSWHDHRTHWMSRTPPASVLESGGAHDVFIFEWTLPLRSDGVDGKIIGSLAWVPSTTPLPWFLVAAIALLAGAAVAYLGSARVQAACLLVLGLLSLIAAFGSLLAQPPEGRMYGIDVIAPAIAIILALWAMAEHGKSSQFARRLVLVGALAITVWGALRIEVLTHPILPTVLLPFVDRLISAVVLGGAIGLVAGGVAAATMANRGRRGPDPRETTTGTSG
jgi:hypothetical protein